MVRLTTMTKSKLGIRSFAPGLVVLCVHLLSGTALGAKEKTPSQEAFEVTVINDCPKAVDARFVVFVPGKKEPTKAEIERAPVVRLLPRSKTSRKMAPQERLIVLDPQGSLSAWFKTKEEGDHGLLRIGADCNSVSEEGAKRR
jgi:hypothetical protein